MRGENLRIPEQLRRLPANLVDWAESVPEAFEEVREGIFDYLPRGRVATPQQIFTGETGERILEDFGANTAWEFSVAQRRNIRDQVSLLPLKQDDYVGQMKRSWLDAFDNPTAPMKYQAGVLQVSKGGRNAGRVINGPYSLYFPSALWPYTTEEGKRYTVMDLAEEPIESDWLGTKPWIEWATDVKYDKIGALPGFSRWGDAALGAGAIAPVAVVGTVAILTFPRWGPFIVDKTVETGTAIGYGVGEIAGAITSKLANFGRN
ncbi:MAG: hypothetical protein CMA60_00010 [Euryarchaeota archaeon]|nr:hypothetical protein [Euryarchaeota archaeon]